MSVAWFDVFAEASSPLQRDELESIPAECLHLTLEGPLRAGEYRTLGELLRRRPRLRLQVFREDVEASELEVALGEIGGIGQLSIRMPSLRSLDALRQLAGSLEHLSLGSIRSRALDLHPIGDLARLRSLSLQDPYMRGVERIAELPALENLRLGGYKADGPIREVVAGMRSLRSLKIGGGSAASLDWIGGLEGLLHLAVESVRGGWSDIDCLPRLTQLEYVYICSAPRISSIASLEPLRRLRRIHLELLKGLATLEGIAAAPHLEELVAVSMGGMDLEGVRSLVGHPCLRSATLGFKTAAESRRAQALLGDLPRAKPATLFEFSNGERYGAW